MWEHQPKRFRRPGMGLRQILATTEVEALWGSSGRRADSSKSCVNGNLRWRSRLHTNFFISFCFIVNPLLAVVQALRYLGIRRQDEGKWCRLVDHWDHELAQCESGFQHLKIHLLTYQG